MATKSIKYQIKVGGLKDVTDAKFMYALMGKILGDIKESLLKDRSYIRIDITGSSGARRKIKND